MTTGIRDRARAAMLSELADALFEVFAARGIDEVTVDEAARAVGISRATFFRYFSSKEEAVLAAVRLTEFDIASTLATLEPVPGETVWQLLRRAWEPTARRAEADVVRMRERQRVINSNATLLAQIVHRRDLEKDETAVALGRWVSDPLAARMLTGSAWAAADLAWRLWGVETDLPFDAILDELFARMPLGAQTVA